MNGAALTLPTGRRGQILAIGISLLGLTLIWFALVSPLLGWYEARADLLVEQQTIAAHMSALIRQIPQLRTEVAAAKPSTPDQQILLPPAPDAISEATLQSTLQTLADQAGTSLDSSDVMQIQPEGHLRRIGIQVSLTAPWPALIAFLTEISTARPRMIVGQISLINAAQADSSGAAPVQADLSVYAFSAGTP